MVMMLNKSYTTDKIAKVTKLDVDTIEQLKNSK